MQESFTGIAAGFENGTASPFSSRGFWPEISYLLCGVTQTLLTGGQTSRWMTWSLPSDTGAWGQLKSKQCLTFIGMTVASVVKQSSNTISSWEDGVIDDEVPFCLMLHASVSIFIAFQLELCNRVLFVLHILFSVYLFFSVFIKIRAGRFVL